MKNGRLFFISMLVVGLAGPAGAVFADNEIMKVGVVDLTKVLNAFYKESPAIKELYDYWKETEAQLDKITREIADLEEKLEAAKEGKDDRAALDLEKKISERKAYRSEYYSFRKTEYEKKYNALSKSSTVFDQIKRVIEYIAVNNSYALILLKSDPSIIYYSKDIDITEDVLEYLNR